MVLDPEYPPPARLRLGSAALPAPFGEKRERDRDDQGKAQARPRQAGKGPIMLPADRGISLLKGPCIQAPIPGQGGGQRGATDEPLGSRRALGRAAEEVRYPAQCRACLALPLQHKSVNKVVLGCRDNYLAVGTQRGGGRLRWVPTAGRPG